jgi:hypothetical protein
MNWFILFPAWAIFNLLALCVNWVLPVFAVNIYGPINNSNGFDTEPRLPSLLAWLDTYDNSLLGDGGFRETHDGGYWSQVAWLYRNSAYGFERSVLAANIKPTDLIGVRGNPLIADKPDGKSGWCFVIIGDYWSFDCIIRWSKSKCTKLSLGWKLKTYAENTERIKTQPIAQYCVTVKPLTDFVE